MPTVIDTPGRIAPRNHGEAQDLSRERPLARHGRPGCWRTLAHRISTALTPTPRERHVPSVPRAPPV